MGALPQGVVTFLLTDIEGSSPLWEAHGMAMGTALARHEALIAEVVASHHGQLIKARGEGDSTLSVFARASDAVAAALALQLALGAEVWPGGIALPTRAALHTGEAERRGGDYYGPTLNRAARLRSLAQGGQILLSRATAELVADQLPAAATLADAGTHQLKGLLRAEQVVALAHPDLAPPPVLDTPTQRAAASAFVGREAELSRLSAALRSALQGQGRLLLVAGEAGIGKTRLAEELAAEAQALGVRVLWGRCHEEQGTPGYWPWIQVLRAYASGRVPAALAAELGAGAAELAQLVPELAKAMPGLRPPPALEPQLARFRLFDAVNAFLHAASRSSGLVVILDDLHWADRGSLLLLQFVARELAGAHLLVLGTYRDMEVNRRHPLSDSLADLVRQPATARVRLLGFDRAEVARCVAAIAGTEPPTDLVAALHQQTEGNPFFVGEVVRLLVTEEDLNVAGLLRAGIPAGVREVIGRRLNRLSDAANQVLTVAAAAGPGVAEPLLAAVTGLGEAALLDGLREAVDQQVLLPEPGGGDGYLFRHALLAEAVYAELLPSERMRLHTALAGALEAGIDAGGPPAIRAARLAYHWSAAGDRPRALAASIEAAAAAEQVYAFAEAQLQLERVLGLWERVADAKARAGMDRVGVLSRCAEAAYAAGDISRAAELVRQALPLADQAHQPQRAGLLHEQLARCLRALADPAALVEQQEAVRLVPLAPSVERARVLGSLALYLGLVSRFAEARGPAEEAVAIAGQVGARAEEADARIALGTALGNLGETDAGLAELEAAQRLAPEAGEVVVMLRAMVNRSDVLLAAGRKDQAATVALDGIQQARRLGLARSFGRDLAGNATEALVALGRWDQAERVSREALELAPPDPAWVGLPLVRAALELGLGDLDAAEARLRTVRRLLPAPIPQAQVAGRLFAGLAELALWRGDPEQAKQLVAEAMPLVEADPRYAAPVYALGLRVEADRAELARTRRPGEPAGDDGSAAALLEPLQAAASPAAASLPELAAWHATALAERTRQQGPSDPAAWAAAVAAWEQLGQPYRLAYACFRQAEALLTGAGDRDAAAVALRRAAEVTGRLGARPLGAEVKALARRARLHLAPHATTTTGAPTPAAQLGLTPREAEVLALVAAGRSNRQIAQALFVSPKTASVHVSNLLAKLGVATRVEAAAVAHRLGLD